nr:hypothetical protein [Tanacetum cinerariifolium]
MPLDLADRSISRPIGVAEDVYVKVGSFHFPADFVVVDFDVDPRVPLILGRSFLKTGRALIDVFETELTLRVGKEAITFNLDQTSRYSANYCEMTAKRTDNYLPEVHKELKICEAKSDKSSVDEPPMVKLKVLPPHLEYAFLKGDDKLPVIIAKDFSVEEKTGLITVLESHKRAIAWKLSDIMGINPEFCTHKILMEEDFEPAVQHQRRVNPKIHDFIKQEVIKLLDAGLIYPISDSPWVSPVHCVQKKGGFTVVENEDNELIPTRLVTGTFQRCMMEIFHDMIEKTMEVFMDNFSVFKNSFQSCLSHLERMLKRCEDTNLCLNWEKSHFMVKEDNIISELPLCFAITPTEPVDSLSMGDEHLNTILATESDEFITSCVENLVPNPSESEGENECDVPVGFTTFSNVLFNDDYDFDSGIDETDCHPEKETRFTKRLLYDNSSPRPPEEFVFDNSDADIESFSSYPIPNEDSDSHMEEIDLSFNPDDPMSDISILEELLDNYSLSLPANESYHFDIPSPYRPPAKPPDGKTGTLNIKMMGDQKVPIPGLTITRILNQEKSPDLLSHQGLEALQPSAECPTMIINGKNIPLLDSSEGVYLARKPLMSLRLATLDQQEVTMAQITQPERAVGENRASWLEKLDDALWVFRTAYKTPIGCTPYKLVYGKACHLPVELEHKAYWDLIHANFDLKTAGDHRKVQINELNELSDQAYENSLIYKEKKKAS